ncbi:hydroxyethylthiazole kinase [Neisseria animalis]|uniref:Hydroxyethylthiazole kinase n=1 Tax=Neisseria animalis TaxID=492 RepID=A0A5P3MP81_NEIAN|nr:hydroxyethylthiazole kinase [Neisseria animalis]QEY23346.1 hydroxyethylthiazole kinase [Neisseria animalis]ROW33194.1 hydroxyethylthiazole kinase [Neisseria animalis]VEE08732.1 Hydroxyethylthiazole kinase [Neisseria animalis]
MKSVYLDQIRRQNPLIHNITNTVAAHLSANGLLAIGASPLMSAALEEMEALPQISRALVINIGTLSGKDPETMILAGKSANRAGIPVILDPVGVAATPYRREMVACLLEEVEFEVIRGNVGELAHLAGVAWQAKGVDAGEGEADVAAIARRVAEQYRCVAAVSGKTDYISDGLRLAKIHNGTPMFTRITASGCLLGAVCGAFAAVAEGKVFEAVCEACTAYAVAGELAAASLKPTELGQFGVNLMNELGALSAAVIEQNARIVYE